MTTIGSGSEICFEGFESGFASLDLAFANAFGLLGLAAVLLPVWGVHSCLFAYYYNSTKQWGSKHVCATSPTVTLTSSVLLSSPLLRIAF